MKKILLAAVLSAFVSGCATLGSEAITQPANFMALKVGESDKGKIFSKFGQPHDVVQTMDKTTWRYISARSSPEPATFILSVIIWPLVIFMQTNYDVSQSDFIFDEKGGLIDVASKKASFTKSLLSLGDAFSEPHKAAVARVRAELDAQKLPVNQRLADNSLDSLAI